MAYCYMEKPRTPILLTKPIVGERSPISRTESLSSEEFMNKVRLEEKSNKYATYFNTQFKVEEVQSFQEYVKDTIKTKKKTIQEILMDECRAQRAEERKKAYEEATTLKQEFRNQKTKVTQQTTAKMPSSEDDSKVPLRKFKYPTLPRDEESHFAPRPSTSYAYCVMNHGSNETRKKETEKNVDEEETNANAGRNLRTETLTMQTFLGKTKRRAPQPPGQKTASTTKEYVNNPPPNDEDPVTDPPPTKEDSPPRERKIHSGKSRVYINPKNEERLQGQAALCKALEAKYKADEERRNAKNLKRLGG